VDIGGSGPQSLILEQVRDHLYLFVSTEYWSNIAREIRFKKKYKTSVPPEDVGIPPAHDDNFAYA
jgi:hypothetical protein